MKYQIKLLMLSIIQAGRSSWDYNTISTQKGTWKKHLLQGLIKIESPWTKLFPPFCDTTTQEKKASSDINKQVTKMHEIYWVWYPQNLLLCKITGLRWTISNSGIKYSFGVSQMHLFF